MSEKQKKTAVGRPGRPQKHGIYSWIDIKRLPRGRAFQKFRRELGQLREELIEEHGGKEIAPDARILVDSVIEGLAFSKLMGLYLREYGVIDGQSAKRGRLEMNPIISRNLISYFNVVRQGLLALKELEKNREKPQAPYPWDIIAAEAEANAENDDKGGDDGKQEKPKPAQDDDAPF